MRKSLLFSISCCAVAALYGQEAADPVSFRCEGIRYQVNADNTANVTVVNVEGYKGADLQLPAQVTDEATGITYQVTEGQRHFMAPLLRTSLFQPLWMTLQGMHFSMPII